MGGATSVTPQTRTNCYIRATEKVVFFSVSCQKLKDVESIVKIVELNGEDLVKDYSDEIERMLGSKMKSVKVRRREGPLPSRGAFAWRRREESCRTLTLSSLCLLSVSGQRLAEAAEDADLYHEYNATLEVSALPPVTLVAVRVAARSLNRLLFLHGQT